MSCQLLSKHYEITTDWIFHDWAFVLRFSKPYCLVFLVKFRHVVSDLSNEGLTCDEVCNHPL